MDENQTESYRKRTEQQNKALHKLFGQLAEVLNDAGLDMKTVLKPEVDIPWTPPMVKEHLWRPIQKIMIDIESTADCSTIDYRPVYETLCRHLADKHGIIPPPWPSRFGEQTE